MSEKKQPLSERVRYWRAERPSEWLMDDFAREIEALETELANKERETAEKCIDLVKENMAARLGVDKSWTSFAEEAIYNHFNIIEK